MQKSLPRMDLSRVRDLTIEYGEGWGYAHACRVMRLVKEISSSGEHAELLLGYAAFLHDWGAYPCFRLEGVPHAQRSLQIAQSEILPKTDLSIAEQAVVLEAIDLHDFRDPRPTAGTALLLREADMLDLLGIVGMAREFAWGPNHLKICLERIRSHRDGIAGRLTLPRAQEIATQRLARMDLAIEWMQAESFEYL